MFFSQAGMLHLVRAGSGVQNCTVLRIFWGAAGWRCGAETSETFTTLRLRSGQAPETKVQEEKTGLEPDTMGWGILSVCRTETVGMVTTSICILVGGVDEVAVHNAIDCF